VSIREGDGAGKADREINKINRNRNKIKTKWAMHELMVIV
jgi:hypothetical protein